MNTSSTTAPLAPPSPTLTLALCQLDIEENAPDANFLRVQQAFAGVQADLLLVPETFNVGFGADMAASAEPAEGPTLRFARQMAREHEALFVGTWCVRHNQQVFNRLHLVLPDGSYAFYDKHHTFRMSTEHQQVAQGQARLTFPYKGWRIRTGICYDLRFPTWLRNKGLDYDLLLLPACWPASRRDAWNTLLRARAIENQAYVVGCNRVGHHYAGDSVVLDYQGRPLAQAQQGMADPIVATLSKDDLNHYRQQWPFYLDAD